MQISSQLRPLLTLHLSVLSSPRASRPSMSAATRFLFARHGQTNFNAEERIQGCLDTSVLTLEGISQVSGLGQHVATSDRTSDIDRVWTSPMTRALQSHAAIVGCCSSAGKPLPSPTVLDGLREIELHHWEGRLKEEIAATEPDGWNTWKTSPHAYRTPSGAAPLLDLWERAARNWEIIRADANERGAGCVLIVAHGALGKAMLGSALGLAPTIFTDAAYNFANAQCVEIEWSHGAQRAARWCRRYPAASSWTTAEEAEAAAATGGVASEAW